MGEARRIEALSEALEYLGLEGYSLEAELGGQSTIQLIFKRLSRNGTLTKMNSFHEIDQVNAIKQSELRNKGTEIIKKFFLDSGFHLVRDTPEFILFQMPNTPLEIRAHKTDADVWFRYGDTVYVYDLETERLYDRQSGESISSLEEILYQD